MLHWSTFISFEQKTASGIRLSLVGSEMCIRGSFTVDISVDTTYGRAGGGRTSSLPPAMNDSLNKSLADGSSVGPPIRAIELGQPTVAIEPLSLTDI